ncbi:MAG: hypothetical protein AAGH67_14380 [Cyanobacteria bacterium P01_H01_bin.162]
MIIARALPPSGTVPLGWMADSSVTTEIDLSGRQLRPLGEGEPGDWTDLLIKETVFEEAAPKSVGAIAKKSCISSTCGREGRVSL